jgi:N-glycosylase/DNA lyase
MEVFARDGEIEIITEDDFDLKKTFECGQCFRWNENPDGSYTGVAMGKAAKVRREGGSIYISGNLEDFENIWKNYFDLDRDYRTLRSNVCIDDYMKKASDYGAGIRILNQDRWEILCSFIISQCNNIPRIKKIVETMCRLFGDPVELNGETFYSFPSAEKIASLSEEDLAPLRSGYRAPYILGAAQKVADGSLDLEALSGETIETARKTLKSLNGIGDKVANCVILFSLRIPNAFPIDVWMKKAIAEHYPDGLDPTVFGDNAGLAQQYMFYYQRESA